METEFDQYAKNYEQQLAKGLRLTGESRLYFLKERLKWLRHRLHCHQLECFADQVMDFGCGTGVAGDYLLKVLGSSGVYGYDVSAASIDIACDMHRDYRLSFSTAPPREKVSLVHVSGVFHHILPKQRPRALAIIREALLDGGVLAFFENNPWNPLMKYSMSQVEFDRDAVMMSTTSSKTLIRSSGFRILSTDYLFFFPALLRCLRPLEPYMTNIPFGAQYLILARLER